MALSGEEKNNIKPQLVGLMVGTAVAASIQLALVPPVISFYEYVITVYFLASLISGYISPEVIMAVGYLAYTSMDRRDIFQYSRRGI